MELMRMFANAVMFNPLPTSERGLGPAFTMQRTDGAATGGASSDDTGAEDVKGYGYVEPEEGGIIRDTRDMFESVQRAVDEWRGVEQDSGLVDTPAVPQSGGGLAGLRGGSTSDIPGQSGSEEEEEVEEEEEEASRTGTARKRRRLE